MKHGGTIHLNPELTLQAIGRLPGAYHDSAKHLRLPEGITELPPPRSLPSFLDNRFTTRNKVEAIDLMSTFIQGVSARAQDPGRWWWDIKEILKASPMPDGKDAKHLIRATADDLGKATRTKRKNAGVLRLPAGQGVRPEPHPKPTLGWYACLNAPKSGGELWFPHAEVVFRVQAGDAVLFPLAGGFAIAPVKEGYLFGLLSFRVPEPRVNLATPSDGKILTPWTHHAV